VTRNKDKGCSRKHTPSASKGEDFLPHHIDTSVIWCIQLNVEKQILLQHPSEKYYILTVIRVNRTQVATILADCCKRFCEKHSNLG